ncbi:MAG: hypothetical protein ACQEP9_08445 [Bacillota bacterium]
MKKIIIIILIIILSLGLYLYYYRSWQQKSKQINELKTEINQPIEIPNKIELEEEPEPKEEEEQIVINSPFQSDLRVVEIREENNDSDNEQDKDNSQKKVIEVSRPAFELLGILKRDEDSLVTIKNNNQFARIKLGDKINEFELVEILKNGVVFEKKEKSFTFELVIN